MEYELYHWGIKGMKWGIRRYQNPDGSLTPAGRKRYSDAVARQKAEEKVIRNRERNKAKMDKLKAKDAELEARRKALDDADGSPKKVSKTDTPKPAPAPKKSVKDMSDDELRVTLNRLRMEDEYRRLNPQQVSKGKKFVSTVVDKVLVPAATEVGKKAVQAMLTKAANKALGVELGGNDKKKDDKK